MQVRDKIIAFLGMAALASCAHTTDNTADMVVSNARIYTVDEDNPWAEALAIKDDRILYVGKYDEVVALAGPSTVHHDLGGRLILPGLIDSHTHPAMTNMEQYGESLPRDSKEAFFSAIKKRAETDPGDGWVRMCCWNIFEYTANGANGPNKKELDAVAPDRPVWITSTTWHSYWVNSKGLETLGIDESTPDPIPHVANYVRDENGKLTGWIKEGAGWQFTAEHFPANIEALRAGIDLSIKTLSEHGITTVYDAGNWDYEDPVYSYLAELDQAGKLPLRYEGTYMVYLPERRHEAITEMHRLRKAYGGDRLKFRTVKLFMDGISPELASGMSKPFSTHPHEPGGTTLTAEELRDWLLELHKAEMDLHVHTIGDLAVKRVLDGVEAAKEIIGNEFYPRVTIAHVEIVDPADLPRFKEVGVSLNFTPWWFGRAPHGTLHPLLGEERSKKVYPVKDILAAGGHVTFSSDDWSESVFTPFLGIQVGHNRHFPEEWSREDGNITNTPLSYEPEGVSLEEMVKGYTLSGAYLFRMEDQIGSLEVGKLADFVVLPTDLFNMHKKLIHRLKPDAVVLEGEVIQGSLEN